MSGEDSKRFEGNQGEGNREAAKAYNEEAQRFVKAGKVESGAADAKAAVEGPEKAELEEAEKKVVPVPRSSTPTRSAESG